MPNSSGLPLKAECGGALEGVTVVEIGPGPGGLTRALIASGDWDALRPLVPQSVDQRRVEVGPPDPAGRSGAG